MAIFGRMQFNEVADVLKNTKPKAPYLNDVMIQWRSTVMMFSKKFRVINKNFDEKIFLKNCDFDDL